MAVSLESLDLSQAEAKKIVKIAIEQEAYDSEMPKSKKEQVDAANEIISFCIDAWKTDGARPDDDDEEVADGAKAILKIFEIAGIEADDDGTITVAAEEDEEDEDEENEEEIEEEDEEGPFDPDDYFEDGYTELTPSSRIKLVKELDPDDEEDLSLLNDLRDWENDQDKPSSRVLNVIDELIGEEEPEDEEEPDEDDEEEEEDEEDDEDEDEEDDEAEGELEEPWEDYDTQKATEIKAQLNEFAEEGELTEENLEYVKDYEQARAQPRVRILKLVEELLEKLEDSDDEDDEDDDEDEEPEETPKRKRSSSKSARNNGKLDEESLKELVPSGLAHTFVNSKLHDKTLAMAGLGEPENWEGDMPELPNELGDMGHDELVDLLAQFTNAHSTALWNASKWYVEADAYDGIAEYLEYVALGEVEGFNEGQRKALARTADEVVTANALQKSAYHNYVRFRDSAKTLEARAKAVSRIGGFVESDTDVEDRAVSKRSTRGAAKGSGRTRSRRS